MPVKLFKLSCSFAGSVLVCLFQFSAFGSDYAKSPRRSQPPVSKAKSCLDRPVSNADQWKEVSYYASSTCKKGHVPPTNKVNYRVRLINGKPEVELNLSVMYRSDPRSRNPEQERARSLDRFVQALKCTEGFFAEHGINLKIAFKEYMSLGDIGKWWKSDAFVNLWAVSKIADVANWPLLNFAGGYISDSRLCKLVSHEVGHLFGLPDRYEDDRCPDRERTQLGERDDVMNALGIMDGPSRKLYPRDYDTIVRPLCE